MNRIYPVYIQLPMQWFSMIKFHNAVVFYDDSHGLGYSFIFD